LSRVRCVECKFVKQLPDGRFYCLACNRRLDARAVYLARRCRRFARRSRVFVPRFGGFRWSEAPEWMRKYLKINGINLDFWVRDKFIRS